MAYGVEVFNSNGVKIISAGETSYYVAKEGTLTPDVSGTTATNFSLNSSLSYAYFLDDAFLRNYNEISNVSTWSSSTTYDEFDLVVKSGSVGAGTLVYEAIKQNTGNDPATYNTRIGNWRQMAIRDNYNRANDALYTEVEGQDALIFFKLPSVGDIITRYWPRGYHYDYDNATSIDYEVPVLSNRSTLDYAVIRPLTDFTPSVSGYGMQVYDAQGDTIHVTSEKLAHIDNFANALGVNSSITASSSAVNWVGIPFYFFGRRKADYNTGNNGSTFQNYIKRDTATNWKHQVDTTVTSTYTQGDPNQIYCKFFIGRFD